MIFLQEATETDLPLMMAWRSNPLIYEGFYTQTKSLTWEEHIKWWESRYNWKSFIVCLLLNNRIRKIGVVTLGQLDHWNPEIGFYIGEVSLWGQGYGKEAVALGVEWLKEHGYTATHTTVKKDNKGSLKLLQSLGFEITNEAREGEVWLHCKIK